jgi:hypothetical protein
MPRQRLPTVEIDYRKHCAIVNLYEELLKKAGVSDRIVLGSMEFWLGCLGYKRRDLANTQ